MRRCVATVTVFPDTARKMHKLFVRIFSCFVLVIALIMGLLAFAFAGSGFIQAMRWREEIFEEYVDAFSFELDTYASYGIFSNERLEVPLLGAADDRVSSLLLRDPEGNLKIAYGKPQGREARLKVMGGAPFQEARIKAPVATIFITQTFDGINLKHTTQVERQPREKRNLLLPSTQEGGTIAGTIEVVVNGTKVGSLDILTFSPMGYRPIVSLLKGIMRPLVWSMAIAAIFALLLSLGVSKRIQAYTVEVRDALEAISHGKHGVMLPKTSVIENLSIAQSIRDLDRQLEQSDHSRREWLNSISHDLATPVTSLKLALDGMAEGVFPITLEAIKKMQGEVDDLADKTSRMAYYANLLNPQNTIVWNQFPIRSFVEEVQLALPASIRERTLFTLKGEILVGDREMLEEGLKELIKNASQSTKGEIAVTVKPGSITVMNEGKIAEGVDFFEPWVKGDKSRTGTGKGNGLGLPIVGEIMHLHHGEAYLEQAGEHVLASLAWRSV